MSYSEHWWRKGERERKEVFPPAANPRAPSSTSGPFVIETFDGVTVRTLSGTGPSATGSISSAEREAWRNSDRLQPWSLLFEYQATPYWQLLRDSRDAEVLRDDDDGATVKFLHPVFEHARFLLKFDAEHRLVRRDLINRIEQDIHPRLYQRHHFASYEQLIDASGERLWYPRRATFEFIKAGPTEHPELQVTAQVIDITSVLINPEIADSMFTIEFPAGVKIVDYSQGFGQELNPAAHIPPFSSEDGSLLPAVGAIVVALVLSGVCYWYARRRDCGPTKKREA